MKKSITKSIAVCFMMLLSLWGAEAQTWLCSNSTSSGSPSGYVSNGITYYKGTAGGTTTVNSGLADCHGSTSNIQMGSSLFILLSNSNITGIIIYGNAGTGSSRTFSSITTSTSLNGTYSTLSSASSVGSITGTQTTNVCSPNSLTINFGTTLTSGTYIKVTLSGNAYVAAIDIIQACTTPASKTVSGSATICSGSSTNVTLTSSQSGVGYDLYKDGSKVASTSQTGNGSDLTWSVNAAGTYTVKTNNTGGYCDGTAMSGSAVITVNATTAISSQSTAAATYGQGFATPAALTVTATGAGLSYQWYQSNDAATNTSGDDVAVGTNSNSYTPSTASMGTSYYYCVVTGSCGAAVTSTVSGAIEIIAACTAPTYSVQPTDNQTECVGGTSTLGTVVADQSATYQWYSVGTKTNTGGTSVGSENGGNTATFTPSSTTPGTYFYYCVATSSACYTASDAVQITVYPTNPIVSQSTPAATYGQNATATAISVTTSGTGLSYQWYSSTDAATNTAGDDVTVGTNSNSFTPPTTSLGTNYYYCVVTGGCSSPVTSNISGAITISPYTVGDYGSIANGTWATTGTWKKWDGSGWNTTASVVPTTSDNVWILNGNVVELAATGNCKNLHIVNGKLYSNKACSNGTSSTTTQLTVAGSVIEVGSSGQVGNGLADNLADGIGFTLTNAGTTTITGGGIIDVGRLILSGTGGSTLIIDNDITVHYHGSSNGGNASGLYPSVTGATLTINAGKTLTMARYSCIYSSTSSNTLQAFNFTINVNGTLTFTPGSPTDVNDRTAFKSYLAMNASAGYLFALNIGATGTANITELYPNGSGGSIGTVSTITVASGGNLNITSIGDFSKVATQNVNGEGGFTLASGATLKTAHTGGVDGSIAVTGTKTLNTGANYNFSGTEAQVTGASLTTANKIFISNSAGVTLSAPTTINDSLKVNVGSKFITGYALTNNGTTAINGTLQLNSGGSISAAPVYGANSTLIYNTGGTYGRWKELDSSTPANLQLSNNTTLNYPNGAIVERTLSGNLTIDAGSALYMDYGTSGVNLPLRVNGNVTLNGNLSLGNSAGGDLYVGGNWSTGVGSNLYANSRAILFNGTTEQTINNAGGASFPYMFIRPGAKVTLPVDNSLTVSNLTIESSSENGTGTLINKGTLTNTNATVNQSFQHAGALRTWYVTPPVASATPSGMSIIKSYDETSYSWSANTTTMLAKVGYQVVPAAAANDIAFNGTLNSGDQTVTLTGRTGFANKPGFNLIGNPYPAYLNWDLVTASTPNTNSMRTTTMWYRTKADGAYGFWTVNGDGVAVPNNASKYIPPMQAFWVRAVEGGGSLVLTSDMTAHAPATDKLLKAPAAVQSALQLLRLQVSNGTYSDEAVIYFSAKASNDLDKIDAPKMSNENPAIPEIYTTLGSEHIVINAMNSIPTDQPIGLGFVPGSATSFSIKASEVSNLPSDVKVILKDNVTLIETDLTDGTASYQFSPETTVGDRFSVIFRSSSTTTALNNNNVNGTQIYWNNQQGLTLRTGDDKLIGSVLSVYNAVGQQLLSKKISGTTMNIEFPYAPDMYIVKINNITAKVIVK